MNRGNKKGFSRFAAGRFLCPPTFNYVADNPTIEQNSLPKAFTVLVTSAVNIPSTHTHTHTHTHA